MRASIFEGGNLSVGSHEAQHIDLTKLNRSMIVKVLSTLLQSINTAFMKHSGEELWSKEVLASGKFLSGSSLHFFSNAIPDETFVGKKPTVGDIDTMVSKEKETALQQFLISAQDKQIGPAVFLGFQRGNEQFSALWGLTELGVNVQIDFEFVEFDSGNPTDWARFSHSSSWDDMQHGIKGVFHKWLIQSLTALTRKQFLQRKMVGRGKARTEEDVPTVDNMFSFAVSSKEGGGLRVKYEPVIDPATMKPLIKDGLPVMTAAPASGYEQNIGNIFSKILGAKLSKQQIAAVQNNFWSFTGLLSVLAKILDDEEKQAVLTGFLEKTIGKGAQGMYKNNPDKDIKEKTIAIQTFLKTLGLTAPSNLATMIDTYKAGYKLSEDAAPKVNFARKGIKHLYNPGSTVELSNAEFIEVCKELASTNGKISGINLKIDGAGIRLGKDKDGRPFFMTSRVNEPKYKENIGDFEAYALSNGQPEERVAFARKYDDAMRVLLNSKLFGSVPADCIVQCEMLLNTIANPSPNGLVFVNIPYDEKKLGKVMTLVPLTAKQFSTGSTMPDEDTIKSAMVSSTSPEIKVVNNRLSSESIPISGVVSFVASKADELLAATKVRGSTEQKQKAITLLTQARKSLSDQIYNSKLPGKDMLGPVIEGLVITLQNGQLVKITSDTMKEKVAAKQMQQTGRPAKSKRVKAAVVTIGSFVGHRGHQQLINHAIQIAKQLGGDPYVYVSSMVGPDDPIPPQIKLETLRQLYPAIANNIQTWVDGGSPMKKIEKELVLPADSPYNKVVIVVGSDRYETFKKWADSLERRMRDPVALAKFGGTQNEVDFEVVRSARDANEGGTGVSFTQLRNALKDESLSDEQKLEFWKRGFGPGVSEEQIMKMMAVSKQGMNLSEMIQTLQIMRPMLKTATDAQKQRFKGIVESFKKARAAKQDYLDE